MKDYKCPHCGTDLSIGMMILTPTNLYGEDYRYTTCRKCDNFLLVNLENFEFCKLPDDKETDFDAIKQFDNVISANLPEELDIIDLLELDEPDISNTLH